MTTQGRSAHASRIVGPPTEYVLFRPSRLRNPRIDSLVTDLQLGPAVVAIPCIFASVARPRALASDTLLLQGRRVAPSGRLGRL